MRNALRNLTKSPGFTAIAVLTLALGIGLNTSMFSLMNLLILRPLPYPDRSHLVRIYRTTPKTPTANVTCGEAEEIARDITGVSQIATYRQWAFTLAHGDRPAVNLNSLRVSATFFTTLGMKPELGRYFNSDEDKPGNHVIVISHATWQAQFGGDPGIVGSTVRIDGEPTTVVGITPPEFSSIFLWGPGDAFRPMAMTDAERADTANAPIALIARLSPNLTPKQFTAELGTLAKRLAPLRPRANSEDGFRAELLQDSARNPATVVICWMMLGLAAFVLLIACANLANLQLARMLIRAQEFAIRSALGASRIRLLQPVLIESLIVSLAGGALGVLVAAWSNDWMSTRLSTNGLVTFAVTMDWSVILFALAVAVVTGIGFGLVPIFVLSHLRVNEVLKSATRGNTGGRVQNRLRHSLIVAQFALALVLLAGAGLFIRGFNRALEQDVGWDRHSLLQGILNLPQTRYTPEQLSTFYSRLQERLSALPGAQNSTVGWCLPMFTYLTSRAFVVEGQTPPPAGHEPMAYVNGVSPSYLPTLKIALIAGRNFTEADTLKSRPVIIINQTMARALFPHENPIGRRLRAPDGSDREGAEIVGVMRDIGYASNFAAPATAFVAFKPLAQEPWGYVTFAVRAPNAERLTDQVRHLIAELDPDLPVQQLNTVDNFMHVNGGGVDMISTLLTGFAALGLFLAALGLYGVTTRLVTQRMPEIGVRVALGAQGRDVVWLILRVVLKLTLIGTSIGVLGAFGLSRVMAAVSPTISMQDPMVIAGVTLLLLIVALVSCWLPAMRATRVDPLVALRAE